MKFIVEIRNVDTLAVHTTDVERLDPQNAHKHVFMNVLESDEEVACISDSEGHIVFDSERGFLP